MVHAFQSLKLSKTEPGVIMEVSFQLMKRAGLGAGPETREGTGGRGHGLFAVGVSFF